MWIDDTPKVLLVVIVSGMGLLRLWAAVDRQSPIALRLRDLWYGHGRRIALAVLAAALFAVVAEDIVFDADEPMEIVSRVDRQVYPLAAGYAPRWRPAASAVSRATGEGLAVGIGLVVIGLTVRRRRRDAWILALGTVTAWAASGLLKGLTAVPRPRAAHTLHLFSSFGFPSGHAFVTLVACLLTASIVGRGASGSTRVVLVTLAWGAALASGVARVIMGAHWPSDVVAGLALGSAWVGVVTVLGESRWGTRRPPAPHSEAARPPSG